jgi:hypothetical protein
VNARQAHEGLRVLQGMMLRAVCEAHSDAELVAIQRDLVTGARRLEAACQRDYIEGPVLAEISTYRADCEAALRRLEMVGTLRRGVAPRLGGGGRLPDA